MKERRSVRNEADGADGADEADGMQHMQYRIFAHANTVEALVHCPPLLLMFFFCDQ